MAKYDPDGRLARALVRAAHPGADRMVKADVALAMVGAPTVGDINEIECRIEKMPAGRLIRAVTQETVRQALAHSARSIVCLRGAFMPGDVEPLLSRLDKAAGKEILVSLRMGRPMRLKV